jgi:hypothetical protein
LVEIEAVFSKAPQAIAWWDLQAKACGGKVGVELIQC